VSGEFPSGPPQKCPSCIVEALGSCSSSCSEEVPVGLPDTPAASPILAPVLPRRFASSSPVSPGVNSRAVASDGSVKPCAALLARQMVEGVLPRPPTLLQAPVSNADTDFGSSVCVPEVIGVSLARKTTLFSSDFGSPEGGARQQTAPHTTCLPATLAVSASSTPFGEPPHRKTLHLVDLRMQRHLPAKLSRCDLRGVVLGGGSHLGPWLHPGWRPLVGDASRTPAAA